MTRVLAIGGCFRLVEPGVAAVQAGHKGRYFTAANELIRVFT